ncbi:unnamed protein product [Candidula unifasciata]|uniref:Ig-like domain-containing protein n=1 Tax=Candidula unifasciata TaxID=100452 RepID=A0A8S3YRH2_9EUPU|nr:unnamed protein product [Candidula unifasciata]
MFHHQVIILAVTCMFISVAFTLEVTPFMQSARPGEDVEFNCGDSENETKSFYVRWSVDDGSQQNVSVPIPEFGRIQAVNGTLTISNISHQDARTYLCDDDAGSDTETGVLIVYEMPEYLEEGLIIGGICLALLLILLVSVYLSMVKQNKERRWRLQQAEKQHKKQENYKLNIND